MSENLLNIVQVINKTSKSRTFIYANIEKGKFPKQVKAGASSLWVESEINAWIDSLIEQRDKAA